MSRSFVSLAVLIAAFLVALLLAPTILLTVFAGILMALFLHGGADLIERWTGLPEWLSLTLFCVIIVGVLSLFFGFAAPVLLEQVRELATRLPEAIRSVRDRLQDIPWLDNILEDVNPEDLATQATQTGGTALSALMGLIGSLGTFVIILFIGLYLSISPRPYINGFVRLFAPEYRPRVRSVLTQAGVALRGWLGAQLAAMTVIGILTWLGLWALGVPLAPVLGLIAGLFAFIPNLGPIIGATPAVLLALTSGVGLALWVIALTIAIQTLESYVLTPQLQKETVDLQPAFTISVQVFFGLLFGTMGLALATPIAAAAQRVIRIFYVERYLEGRSPHPPTAGDPDPA